MYSQQEYEKRIKELQSVALDFIQNKRPIDLREAASKMTPEDAYILGMHIGTILQVTKLVPVK